MKDSEGEGDRDGGKIRPEDRLRQGTGWHGKECWDEEGEGAKIREMVKGETGRWNMQGIEEEGTLHTMVDLEAKARGAACLANLGSEVW